MKMVVYYSIDNVLFRIHVEYFSFFHLLQLVLFYNNLAPLIAVIFAESISQWKTPSVY